jgi:hypothetical protein
MDTLYNPKDVIWRLSLQFPKCFFEDARLRRPLKPNIDDVEARQIQSSKACEFATLSIITCAITACGKTQLLARRGSILTATPAVPSPRWKRRSP